MPAQKKTQKMKPIVRMPLDSHKESCGSELSVLALALVMGLETVVRGVASEGGGGGVGLGRAVGVRQYLGNIYRCKT